MTPAMQRSDRYGLFYSYAVLHLYTVHTAIPISSTFRDSVRIAIGPDKLFTIYLLLSASVLPPDSYSIPIVDCRRVQLT